SVSDVPEFQSKYEAIFDQASDAIVMVLPDGRIDGVNQAFEEMTGFLKSELIGNPVDRLFPDRDRHKPQQRARPLSREMFAASGTYEDVAVLRKDGYIRFVDLGVRSI